GWPGPWRAAWRTRADDHLWGTGERSFRSTVAKMLRGLSTVLVGGGQGAVAAAEQPPGRGLEDGLGVAAVGAAGQPALGPGGVQAAVAGHRDRAGGGEQGPHGQGAGGTTT